MPVSAICSIHARIAVMTETPQKIANPERVEFMRRIHLFYRLEDNQLDSVAGTAREKTFQPGETIIRQGGIE